MMPAPIAFGLTVSETFIVEMGTRRTSTINAFNRIRATSFPYTLPPFTLTCLLTGGEGEGEVTLVVTHLATDEGVYSLLPRLSFSDRFAEVRFQVRIDYISFPQPGQYLFALLVDDDWIAHRRVEVF